MNTPTLPTASSRLCRATLALVAGVILFNVAQAAQPAGNTNAPASRDFSAFQIIADRNIFNASRVPRRPGQPSTPRPTNKSAETFSLVGTMFSEKGSLAFFDGTGPEHRKAIKLDGAIAGYTVVQIDPKGVRLVAGTNQVDLKVGNLLRHEEDGTWTLAAGGALPQGGTKDDAATGGSPTTDGAGSNEVLKRLMQRRQQEMSR